MADMQDLSDLEYTLRRNGNKMVHQMSGFKQRTLDMDFGEQEDDESMEPGRARRPVKADRGNPGVDIVNVNLGGTGNAGTVDDGSPRPTGGNTQFHQGRKKPVLFSAVLQFNLGEIDIANGSGDSPDKHIKTVRAHGSMVGALMARAVNDPSVPEPADDVLATVTSLSVPSIAGWLEEATYEVRADADDSLIGEFTTGVVQGAWDGTGTVNISGGAQLGFPIDVSAQTIYIKGMGDPDKQFGSFQDVTDNTVDMYGLLEDSEFPAGMSESIDGAFANEDAKTAVSILEPLCTPDSWLTTPRTRDRMVNAQNDNVQFIPGMGSNSRDPFHDAMVPLMCGIPIIGCPQAVEDDILLGAFREHASFREHIPYAPQLAQGVGPGSWEKATLQPSELVHGYKLPCRGWFAFLCDKRRAFLRIANVTS